MSRSEHRDRLPSEDEVLSWLDRLSNWGRWGKEDRLGTLNFVTADKRRAAAASVRTGEVVSCAWDVVPGAGPEHVLGGPQRFMLSTGEGLAERRREDPAGAPRWAGAAEWVGMAFHGYGVTHLDALSHYFWDDAMYGGHSASRVTARSGAEVHDVRSVAEGVVTRGVLLDVAAVRDVPWLEPGEGVLPADLEAAEERQGVRVESGDAVLLRTGYGRKRRERGPDRVGEIGRAGWHAACLPWIHRREVALIACDTAQDVHPSGYRTLRSPVHAVGITALGLWLLDNCDLEPLAERCAGLGHWHFLFTVAPLRLAGATGSPVNPLAVL